MSGRAYVRAPSVARALAEAERCAGRSIYVAGGTDLLVHAQNGLVPEEVWIDLTAIEELRGIEEVGDRLRIGALTTLEEVERAPVVRERLPILAEAARAVGSPVIRKSATLGGNLLVRSRCLFYNQSASWREGIGSCLRDGGEVCRVTGASEGCLARNVSDTAPALIALGATVSLRNRAGKRTVPLEELYADDGLVGHRQMEGNALLASIEVEGGEARGYFRKLRLRRSVDFSSLTVAGALRSKGRLRVSIGAVSPAPLLVETDFPLADRDRWIAEARRRCRIVKNDFLSVGYRRAMLDLFLRKMIEAFGGP